MARPQHRAEAVRRAPEPRVRPGSGSRASRRWLVAALVTLVAALGEATLRVAHFGPTRAALGRFGASVPWERLRTLDATGATVLRPGGEAAWALAPGEPAVRYRLNGAGLRDDAEVAPRAPAGTCRVLALGDAYTFGYGVSVEQAYPARLGRQLRPRGGWEVLNAGFPNLDAVAQRRRLRSLLPALHPDVVLASFSWWNVPRAPEPPAPRRWSRRWLARNVEARIGAVGEWIGLVHEGFRLARHALTPAFFEPSGLARELEPLGLPPDRVADRWSATEAALAGMAADAAAAGARLALVATPLDLQVDARRNRLYRRERLPYPSHGFVDRDYTRADAMPAALHRFAAASGIPLLDLTPALRRSGAADLFLATDYHAAPAGHRLMAREVARWLAHARLCTPRRRAPPARPNVAGRVLVEDAAAGAR